MKNQKFLKLSCLLSSVLFLLALTVDFSSFKKGDTSVMLAAAASGETECTYPWQHYECYDGYEDGTSRCLHVSDPEYEDECES